VLEPVAPDEPLTPVTPAVLPVAAVTPVEVVAPVVAVAATLEPVVVLGELPVTPVGPAVAPGKTVVVVTSSLFDAVVGPVEPVVTAVPMAAGAVVAVRELAVVGAARWWRSLAWCTVLADAAAIIDCGSVAGS